MNIVFFSVGNPGPLTRHSTGHYVIKELVSAFDAKQMTKKPKYSFTSLDNVYFVRSNSYMNDSGRLLRAFLTGEKIRLCVVVVVYDDFELNMPKVRLQPLTRGSHNGIKSVASEIQSLGVSGYKLGVGIGPKPSNSSKDTMARWVLASFTEREKEYLETSMEYVFKYVHHILETEGEVGDCAVLNAQISKSMV